MKANLYSRRGWSRIIIASILGGALLVAGCQPTGQATPAGGSSETKTTSAKRAKLAVSIPAATHGWTAGVIWWAERAKAMYPDTDIQIVTADTSAKQITDIENLMTQNIDGLVVLAMESAPLTPVAMKVRERGILLVNVDRGFTEPAAHLFIEGDNVSFGRKSAEFMGKKLNGQGNILVLEGIPSTVNTARLQGFNEVLKRDYPGVKILEQQPGNWNRDQALKVTQNMLAKHPQVDAVWASDDDMALGVEQALKEAGRSNVWILGGAGMKEVIKRTMDGDPMFPGNVTYPPSMVATAIHMAVGILRDGKREEVMQFMPRTLRMDVDVVTPENAKEFYFPDSKY